MGALAAAVWQSLLVVEKDSFVRVVVRCGVGVAATAAVGYFVVGLWFRGVSLDVLHHVLFMICCWLCIVCRGSI